MQADEEALRKLNEDYVRSVQESDVGWFEAHLSDDFLNSNPDGIRARRGGRWLCVAAHVTRG